MKWAHFQAMGLTSDEKPAGFDLGMFIQSKDHEGREASDCPNQKDAASTGRKQRNTARIVDVATIRAVLLPSHSMPSPRLKPAMQCPYNSDCNWLGAPAHRSRLAGLEPMQWP